jgi:8-oxo-dGTP pyrophosphatase MutT (NUDIX family)
MAGKGTNQVAALPFRQGRLGLEVLLITSRETKRWVIPKGWPMPHLMDFNAAKREAYEEAGVEGRIRRRPIGAFRYGKILKTGETRQLSVTIYLLHVTTVLRSWPERGQRKRQWFTPAEAAKAVHEPGLQKLIRTFRP